MKGKNEPVAIFEPIAERSKISDEQQFVEYSNNLLALYRHRRFKDVLKLRDECCSKLSEKSSKSLTAYDQASEFIETHQRRVGVA